MSATFCRAPLCGILSDALAAARGLLFFAAAALRLTLTLRFMAQFMAPAVAAGPHNLTESRRSAPMRWIGDWLPLRSRGTVIIGVGAYDFVDPIHLPLGIEPDRKALLVATGPLDCLEVIFKPDDEAAVYKWARSVGKLRCLVPQSSARIAGQTMPLVLSEKSRNWQMAVIRLPQKGHKATDIMWQAGPAYVDKNGDSANSQTGHPRMEAQMYGPESPVARANRIVSMRLIILCSPASN